jgi:hypothetical protein
MLAGGIFVQVLVVRLATTLQLFQRSIGANVILTCLA